MKATKERPLATFSMATHSDFHGVYFTVQALRLHHPELMRRSQLVVVDQAPNTPDGRMVRDLCNNVRTSMADVKYIEMLSPSGTSPSRNKCAVESDGVVKFHMDCHVLFVPGAIDAMMDVHMANPGSLDLYTGPMIYDSLHNCSTHFDDEWGGEMWGRWGCAWQCKCGGSNFAITDVAGIAFYRKLQIGCEPYTCPACGITPPLLQWFGHEKPLGDAGYIHLGFQGEQPFEIPGNGLGFYSYADGHIPFEENCTGFGGEELCWHELYRQNGRKVWCVPQAKWLHRFGRPEGVRYPIPRWGKIRNYVLWFKKLGRDMTPIYDQFVKTNLIKQEAWDALAADPIGAITEPNCKTCGADAAAALAPYDTADKVFDHVAAIPRDIDQHMKIIRHYASTVEHVTEFSGRRESTIAIIAGRPKVLVSHSIEHDTFAGHIATLCVDTTKVQAFAGLGENTLTIDETDFLFLDTLHTYPQLRIELEKFGTKTRRYIMMHDTDVYGARGEDGGIGMIQAMADFCKAHPEWEPIYHTSQQYGLTVLGKEQDCPPQMIALFSSPGFGPGTELKKILLETFGITPPPDCDCNARAAHMDWLGVSGCKRERERIVAWVKEGAARWGWQGFFTSLMHAAASPSVALKINPFQPYESIVDLAIAAAERGQ